MPACCFSACCKPRARYSWYTRAYRVSLWHGRPRRRHCACKSRCAPHPFFESQKGSIDLSISCAERAERAPVARIFRVCRACSGSSLPATDRGWLLDPPHNRPNHASPLTSLLIPLRRCYYCCCDAAATAASLLLLLRRCCYCCVATAPAASLLLLLRRYCSRCVATAPALVLPLSWKFCFLPVSRFL